MKVTVGISGTGRGFRRFCEGEIDLSNASREKRSRLNAVQVRNPKTDHCR